MKYIKKFETLGTYKVGDYVLLDVKKLENEDFYKTNHGLVKIIRFFSYLSIPYLVMFPEDFELYVEADKILRLLTPEEIEKYNSIMTAKNYNL